MEENGKFKTIIHANDWITITPINLIKRIMGLSSFMELEKSEKNFLQDISKNMSIIKDVDGSIVGRAFLYKQDFKRKDIQGIVTVGGFKSSGLTGLIGIFIGSSVRASRDVGIPDISLNTLSEWATNQANLLSTSNLLNDETEIECASIVRRCGGNTGSLKIAHHRNVTVNLDNLKQIIKYINSEDYLIIQDAHVFIYKRDTSSEIEFLENAFWVSTGSPGIMQIGNTHNYFDWPNINYKVKNWFHSETLQGLIIESLSEVWGNSIEQILKNSDISTDKKYFSTVVGFVEGNPLTFDNIDIMKRLKK